MAYKFNPFTGNLDDAGSGVPDPLTLNNLTVNTLLTADHIHGNIAGSVYIHVKNTDTVQLDKGTPFYITGTVGASDRVEIKAADSSDPAKGPAVGLVESDLAVNGEGNGTIIGEIFNYDTDTPNWSTNDPLYVANGGGITNVQPTTGYRQIVAYVGRIQQSTGTLVLTGTSADPVAGSNTQIQYNDNGGFGASADLTWDDTAKELGVGGDINLNDGGTYATTLQLITPTANRTISFPDATGTVGLVGGSSGQLVYNNAGAYAGAPSTSVGATGNITLSLAGAASTPPVSLTGTWFSGGTSTTTKPQLLIEPVGTTSTAWSTSGTGLGVNAASGFAGNLLDLQVNGSSKLYVNKDGNIAVPAGSQSAPSLTFTGDPNTGIYSPGADQVAISTNSSERIRIGANGEIGLSGANYGISGEVLTSAGPGAAPTWQSGGASLEGETDTASPFNTYLGYQAGNGTTTANSCVAVGYQSLYTNSSGLRNTAVGYNALYSNTTGSYNTANGYYTLYDNTTGASNTANGAIALINNTTGSYNTTNGAVALYNNTTGSYNTANGYYTLYSNTTGNYHTANGYQALYSNITGIGNTANGFATLYNNTTGSYNVANGYGALRFSTTGSYNVANGYQALYNNKGNANVCIGSFNSSGSYAPVFDCTSENDRVVMSSTSVTNAYIQVAWTVVSDARDKMNFNVVPHGLEFVKQLNPVAFQFKETRDSNTPHGPVRYGFKAQDILALEGEDNAVIIDNENPDKLRYNGEALVPVLVNAIKEQQTLIEAQQQQINDLIARLDAAGI